MMNRASVKTVVTAALVALLPLAAASAAAHGGAASSHSPARAPAPSYHSADEHPFGRAADPASASTTIEVDMRDGMRFEPDRIEVERGETVRFVVRNRGQLLHEMVLGTLESLTEHAELMKRFPGMEHDEPYMAHVAPAGTHEMGWQFTRAGEFHYGCLVPGHFDGGMKGTIVVR